MPTMRASSFVRWTMPSPSRSNTSKLVRVALGAPRLVSTPSAKRPGWAGLIFGLGSALPRRNRFARYRYRKRRRARGFAEFEGFCTDRFRPGTQSLKSAMFTNFITRAGRTRFYHWSRRAQRRIAGPTHPPRANRATKPTGPSSTSPTAHSPLRCRPKKRRNPQPSNIFSSAVHRPIDPFESQRSTHRHARPNRAGDVFLHRRRPAR